MSKNSNTYTQVYLEGPEEKHLTRWVRSGLAIVGKKVGEYRVLEVYASYPEEFIKKYPKDFRTL